MQRYYEEEPCEAEDYWEDGECEDHRPWYEDVPVLGEISGGPVRILCPRLIYRGMECRFPGHLAVLSLQEADELTDFLCAHDPVCDQCERMTADYFREEMAFSAHFRGAKKLARKHRDAMQDPSFVDQIIQEDKARLQGLVFVD